MMEKIKKYLEEQGLQVDDLLLKYVEKGVDISEKDEDLHDFGTFPPNHNESWYFNFIDRPNKVFFITRLSYEMHDKRSLMMCIIIIDGQIFSFYKDPTVEVIPEKYWEINKQVKYYCIKPMKQWRVTLEDKRIKADFTFDARFPVFNYLSNEDPLSSLKKYGIEMFDLAAQQHYEQGMKATGTILMKKTGETRKIDSLGHRDHSWGTRDWGGIDGWNWISAQFEDETINIANVRFLGKKLQNGFISSKDGNVAVKKVEVTTKTKEDGKTPLSSVFLITDENGKKRTLTSNTIFSLHLPLPSTEGVTEVFEQIVTFETDGKEGDGVSEYLISTRK